MMMAPGTVIILMKRDGRGSLQADEAGQKKHDEKTHDKVSGSLWSAITRCLAHINDYGSCIESGPSHRGQVLRAGAAL